MKKMIRIAASVLFSFLLAVSVFADVAFPIFESYDAYIGTDGLNIMEFGCDDLVHLPLELGDKITVVDEFGDGEYIVEIPGYPAGRARITVDELANTYAAWEDMPPEKGEKLGYTVICDVSEADGAELRTGPSDKFPLKTTLSHDTRLEYEYVYGDRAYVKGLENYGWVKLADVTTISSVPQTDTEPAPTEPPVTEPVTEVIAPSTEPAPVTDTAADTKEPPATETASTGDAPSTDKEPVATGPAATEPSGEKDGEKSSGLSPSMRIVLCCIVVAVILSLTVAAIIALIVKADRKKSGRKKGKKGGGKSRK